MTVRELIEFLQKVKNQDAVVFVEADHGQLPEQAHYTELSNDAIDYYGNEMHWNDVNSVDSTAVCIRA